MLSQELRRRRRKNSLARGWTGEFLIEGVGQATKVVKSDTKLARRVSSGRGAIVSVTSQRIVKIIFKTIILK